MKLLLTTAAGGVAGQIRPLLGAKNGDCVLSDFTTPDDRASGVMEQ